MDRSPDGPNLSEVAEAIGDGLRLLTSLVAIAPTNLEDPVHGRYEKPNYLRAADELTRWARAFGLSTRRFDPVVDLPPDPVYRGIARPSVIVDLEGGSPERLLILAHYDVVPVPAEQLAHWKSPPHSLTYRGDGRLYGRGANDDLGSGVVSSLLAMKRLAEDGRSPRSVRLVICCDEETGGLGGIEAIKRSDERRPPGDPDRFLLGDVALIPDGSPHATAGSSGLVFLDASFESPVPLRDSIAYGTSLVGLHDVAKAWRSAYRSPDWPDHGAPEPVITGRATLTRFDLGDDNARPEDVTLIAAHSENEAANQIAEAVTLVFVGPQDRLSELLAYLRGKVELPFRLISPATSTSLRIPERALSVQLVGRSAHAGYPHRAYNPVPTALELLRAALADRRVSSTTVASPTFAVDLRLIPEMPVEPTRSEVLHRIERWIRDRRLPAAIAAPIERARGGYCVAPDHPALQKLERLVGSLFGEPGVFGEYGGTDASSLAGVRTRAGAPLPALVFGSMDRAARIHEAEESVDPRAIARVSTIIERFASEP